MSRTSGRNLFILVPVPRETPPTSVELEPLAGLPECIRVKGAMLGFLAGLVVLGVVNFVLVQWSGDQGRIIEMRRGQICDAGEMDEPECSP